MLNPRSILVAIPSMDGKVVAELAGSLINSAGLFGAISVKSEVSHVSLVRNIIAAQFMASDFEWMVCIDSDIAFTPQDFRFLLEPWCQTHILRDEPQPTRVDVQVLDKNGTPFHSAADSLVCAEYAYKNDLLEPCRMGLGFTRIHRSVFEALQNLKHDDGSARLWQYRSRGVMCYDYYPSGPFVSQMVPTGDWKGEDHGFFTLCMLAGIVPRIETRTQLVHYGRKGYPYQPNASDEGGQ